MTVWKFNFVLGARLESVSGRRRTTTMEGMTQKILQVPGLPGLPAGLVGSRKLKNVDFYCLSSGRKAPG
jgi:hypothetical protein